MRIATLTVIAVLAAVPAARAQGVNIRVGDNDPTLRILQDYTLRQGESARDVLVIAGDATLEGHVDGDVVVIAGKARLSSTAAIDGSLVVVAGTGVIADGARVGRDVVAIGNLDAPPSFSPGGKQVIVGTLGLDERVRSVIPWLTRGLLLGRPIVPDLRWVWVIAGIFFLVNLLFNVVLDAPVRACATTLRATPLSAFLVGLLVLLLAGPLCLLLAISVVGIAVIPFLVCALLLAAIVGRVGFARWIGMSVLHESDPASRGQALRSFVLGSALMCAAYMVPILGFTVWALAGVFGLGAAAIAFFSAYRRENPKRPKKPPITAPPAPAAPEPAVSAAAVVPPVPPADLPLQSERAESGYLRQDYGGAPEHSALAEDPASSVARGDSILSFSHATFLERLAAFGLDFVLIAILSPIVRLDRLFGEWSPEGNLLLVALVYHIAFWTWKQTTVGGIVCRLRVIRVDGAPMRFAEAFVRGLSGIFSLVVAGAGFLWILRDPERQAWHDRIAGTFVVNVPKNWPI
jgi:uncharacterized RDD family membrane protein YckC